MSKNKILLRILLIVLVLLPPLYLGKFLYSNSFNTPFWDQWEIVPIIQHINDGNLYLSDFTQQHNEHRILFPRVLMLSAAFITEWNVRYELFISLGLAVLSFVVLIKILQLTSKKTKLSFPWLLLPILSLVWFSLTQQENWLWGWQIQWFLSVLGIMVVLLGFAIIRDRKISWKSIGLIVGGAILAQYSLGNGVLIWPIAILGLLYLRVMPKRIAAVGAAGFVGTLLYYFNYADPVVGSSKTVLFQQPVAYIKYVFAYIGRPLSAGHRPAMLLGLLLVVIFFATILYLFLYKKKRFVQLLPWTMLGLYALASALVTGASRLGLGLNQAYSSRYTTISSLFLVSVIVLLYFSKDIIRKRVRYLQPIAVVVAVLLVALVWTTMSSGIKDARAKAQYLKDIKSCTSQVEPYEICLLSTYPNKEKLLPRLEYLKSIHWGGY